AESAFAAATTGAAPFRKEADWFFENKEERLNMTLHYTIGCVSGLKNKKPRRSGILCEADYARFFDALRFFVAFFAVFLTALRFFAAMVVGIKSLICRPVSVRIKVRTQTFLFDIIAR